MAVPNRVAGRLDTVFQPIVSLATGRIEGYEALGRVTGPDGGTQPIPELLGRAYDEGWLLVLDRALRRRALERIAERRRDPSLRWYLNVDSRCADDPTFDAGFTRRALDELELADLSIVIELSERDPHLDEKRVARLYPNYARQGFAIALDDFGAGHASLSRLLDVRPDVVKLDGTIIAGIADDPLRAHMVRAITSFARAANILLVAEGIERPSDLAAVVAAGVPLGQGYLLGRPAPLPETSVATVVREVVSKDKTAVAASRRGGES